MMKMEQGKINYDLFQEGKTFKIDKHIMDYFVSHGVTNELSYPFVYWKGMVSDRHVKKNWPNIVPDLMSSSRSGRSIKLYDNADNELKNYYIVGNACLWLSDAINGLDRIDIISDVKASKIEFSEDLEATNMDDPSNWNKTPLVEISNIKVIYYPKGDMTIDEAVMSGICDADMMAYDANDDEVYMTQRGLNFLRSNEVWLEPNRLDDDYANRLVQLYGLGFKINIPKRHLIKLYGVDITDDDKGVIEDMYYANEGGDGENWEEDIASLSRDQKDMANICLYSQSRGYTAYKKIVVSPLDRVLATLADVVFREPVVNLRQIVQKDVDINIKDLYMTSKYIANIDDLLDGKTLLEYQYDKYIRNRVFNTPDDFGFKTYPTLFRDIAYLINNGLDELVFLGQLNDSFSIDDGINSGTYVISGVLDKIHNPYVCVHDSIHARDNINSNYEEYAFDQGLFRKVPEQYYFYLKKRDRETTLRDAIFYSKIDLEQIAYSPQDGGVYCSLLFLYAYYNKVHTMTPSTHINVIHRIRNGFKDLGITFFNPIEDDSEPEPINHVSNAIEQYILYEGELLFKDNGYDVDEEELSMLNNPSDKIINIVKSAMKHGLSLGDLPHYAGMGLPYPLSYTTASNMLADKFSFLIHPLDYYPTLGSGDHLIYDYYHE